MSCFASSRNDVDLAAGKLKWRCKGHTGSVLSVAFSPDGKPLASGCAGKKLIFWDMATGKEKGRAKVEASIYSLTFSPPDSVLAYSLDGLKLWSLRNDREHSLNTPIRGDTD